MAEALNVEPAVAITAATKPIAIFRIMVLTPSHEHPQPLGIKPNSSH
jgi:hypothetical protein